MREKREEWEGELSGRRFKARRRKDMVNDVCILTGHIEVMM